MDKLQLAIDALQFYAHGNHKYSHPENAVSDYHWDNGKRAREALATIQVTQASPEDARSRQVVAESAQAEGGEQPEQGGQPIKTRHCLTTGPAPDVASKDTVVWMLERTNGKGLTCLGECNKRLKWTTFTSDQALKFDTKEKAEAFAKEQSLENVEARDHMFMTGPPSDTTQTVTEDWREAFDKTVIANSNANTGRAVSAFAFELGWLARGEVAPAAVEPDCGHDSGVTWLVRCEKCGWVAEPAEATRPVGGKDE